MARGVDIRDNSIRITFTFEGQQYRPTLKVGTEPMPPTPANIKYATKLVDSIRDKIKHGVFSLAEHFPQLGDVTSVLTVGSQLDTWLSAQRIEASTKAGYESAIRFWKDAPSDDAGVKLGVRSLRATRTSHVLRALASRPDLSGKTVNNYVSVLREAFDLAVTDKLLQHNPVSEVKRAKHQKEPPDPFSREESAAILAHMAAKLPAQVANMVQFWFWTGLRTSEIFALKWDSIDLASGRALVREAVVRGVHKDKTKTAKTRTLLLNSLALAAITAQRSHSQLKAGATEPGVVFLDPRYGTAWEDERAFRRSFWTPALRALKIRYRRPYQMRHSYATAMLMAGMTPAFCAQQLGHSIEMFLTTYSRWLNGAQNDLEMKRLEATFTEPGIKPGINSGTTGG